MDFQLRHSKKYKRRKKQIILLKSLCHVTTDGGHLNDISFHKKRKNP